MSASSSKLTAGRLARGLFIAAALAALAIAVSMLLDTTGPSGRSLSLLNPWSDTASHQIFFRFRLPRVLGAAVVGAGLAAAGCTFQATLRNPLAEPFTLGISSGSALAAVIAIRIGLDQTVLGYSGIGLAALVGAMITVYIVWRLGRVGAALPPATLLLAGVTIAMFCGAASMLIQVLADFRVIYRIVHWMMGGLHGTRLDTLVPTAIAVGSGLLVLLTIARDLNALSAGPDAAASVGVNAKRTTTIALFTSSLIVGASIALAGPIGFVGLIVPHAVRAIVGPDHRILLPASILVGAALLVTCDCLARELLPSEELPTGIVTALLGGPFFLYLLLRQKNRSQLWGGA